MSGETSDGGFVRCGHCRGFYEMLRGACRYCGKDVPQKTADGKPRVYPDRATCRAIQIAEFEQLPAAAHDDPFQPDPDILDKKCACLHCGQGGGVFEAVEMRWMANENMWACPCTTCGGRGFGFDVHLAEPLWQCAECHHWYYPAKGDFRGSNAKCPKCGCTMANGWFDDEDDDEDMAEEELAREELSEEDGVIPEGVELTEAMPWEEGDGEAWKTGMPEEALPGVGYAAEPPADSKLPDDIDFPREPRKKQAGGEDDDDLLGPDSIPF